MKIDYSQVHLRKDKNGWAFLIRAFANTYLEQGKDEIMINTNVIHAFLPSEFHDDISVWAGAFSHESIHLLLKYFVSDKAALAFDNIQHIKGFRDYRKYISGVYGI